MKPTLHILVCSTRPGRVGPAVADWVYQSALAQGRFEPKLVDLASFQLPVFDEAQHPRLQKYQHAHTKAWADSVDSADAFIFVLPEYNHAPPSALVNAMTFLSREWHYKPVAFVSYGGVSGGLRSVQLAKQMLLAYKAVPVFEGVSIPNVAQFLDPAKGFVATESHTSASAIMLDELARWTPALQTLRA